MTSKRTRFRTARRFAWIALGAHLLCAAKGDQAPSPPSSAQLDRLIGEKLPQPVTSVKWLPAEPPQTNLLIYTAQAQPYQPALFKSLATALGIHGDPQPLRAGMFYAPGYWIKEPNPTNKESWKALIFCASSGMIRYSSGEDNHRWDLKNHKPLADGVPSEKEALQRTLALLPALGMTTNDVEHLPDGRIRYACNDEGTQYNDRYDGGKRKRYIRQINIELWQKLQDGASILSMGGGGMFTAGYISDGKLADMQMIFRRVTPIGNAKPATKAEIIKHVKAGDARTFRNHLPRELTVTNCAIVYPQADASTKQDALWPVYALDAVAVEDGETNNFRLYNPLLKAN